MSTKCPRFFNSVDTFCNFATFFVGEIDKICYNKYEEKNMGFFDLFKKKKVADRNDNEKKEDTNLNKLKGEIL